MLSIARIATLLATLEENVLCTHVDARPLVLFSGTRTWQDLVFDDLNVKPRRWPTSSYGGAVHGGFAERTRRLATEEAGTFLSENNDFVIGGHSLGGACAILTASLLRHRGKRVDTVYTFGVPCLATPRFQTFYTHQGLWNKTTNYYTPRDPVVTRLPNLYKRVGSYAMLPCDADDVWLQHDMASYVAALDPHSSSSSTRNDPS